MDLKQLHTFVVKPTLETLGLGGKGAERLLLGTALTESGLKYISQIPSGIAKGIYQMEKATHDDIWENFLLASTKRSDLRVYVEGQLLSATNGLLQKFTQLQGNLYYATAMCRVHYLRAKSPLPSGDSLEEMAGYWKKYYNTVKGAGTIQDFMNKAKEIMSL